MELSTGLLTTTVNKISFLALINSSKEKIPFSFLIRPTYNKLVSKISLSFTFSNHDASSCEGETILPFSF